MVPGQKVTICNSAYTHVETFTVVNVVGTTVTLSGNLVNSYTSGSALGVSYGINISGTLNRFTFLDCSIGAGANSLPGEQIYCTDTSNTANSSRLVFTSCDLGFVGTTLNASTVEWGMGTIIASADLVGEINTFTNGGTVVQYGGGSSGQYPLGQMIFPGSRAILTARTSGVNQNLLTTDGSGNVSIGDASANQGYLRAVVAPGLPFAIWCPSLIAGPMVSWGNAGTQWAANTPTVTTGGTVTLGTTVTVAPYIIFQGTLTSNLTVILPTSNYAEWTLDFTAMSLGAGPYTITLEANGIPWSGVVNITSLYKVLYGGQGQLYITAMPAAFTKRTVTLSGSAANPDIPTYGSATLYSTVASGTVTIDGLTASADQQRVTIIVEGFVAVNVLNDSASELTAANQILTPTGTTLNLNSAGANAYTVMDFLYDGAVSRWRFLP
jgi:hypothetical protein